MQHLALDEFQARAECYNTAVAGFDGIDPFCSRTDWILPFHAAFTPDSPLYVLQQSDSFLALAQSRLPHGQQQLFSSVDCMWGFAAALVGEGSSELLAAACAGDLRQGHIVLYGLPPDRDFLTIIAARTQRTHRAFMLNPVNRCVTSLQGGLGGFLGRRTRKFRANARRALKRTEQAGLRFRYVQELPTENLEGFYDEILAIERSSWKALKGEGVDQPPMRVFYRRMFERIGPAGLLRAIVAELDGRPAGYIHGAAVNGRFRGLQFSFDDRFRALSIGTVLQLKMLEWMIREDVLSYDFGMCVPYKKSWSELEQATLTLYLRPV